MHCCQRTLFLMARTCRWGRASPASILPSKMGCCSPHSCCQHSASVVISPYGPYVNFLAVVRAAQQQLRRAIPARADIVSDADFSSIGRQLPGKPKVTQLQLSNTGAGCTCTGEVQLWTTPVRCWRSVVICQLQEGTAWSFRHTCWQKHREVDTPGLMSRFSGLMSLCTASWLWIQFTACTSW